MMLDKLKKYFNPEEETVEMTTETNQADLSVEAVAAELTETKASLAQVSETLATTKAELEAAQAALAEVEQVKAAAEAAAAQAKADARMAKIVEAVGDAQAADLMEATKELNDEAFDKILGAVGKTHAIEAKSEMFTETGVDAPAKQEGDKKPVSFKNFTPKSK